MTFDDIEFMLYGTAPDVLTTTTYTIYINASSVDFDQDDQVQINLVVEYEALVETTEVKTTRVITTTAVAVGGALNIAVGAGSNSSPVGLWSLLNQLQLLIHFTLIKTELAADVQLYIEGMDFALVNFDFLKIRELDIIKIPVEWVDGPQDFEGLDNLGLGSRSTFSNQYNFLWTLLIVFSVHMLLKFILKDFIITTNTGKLKKLWNTVRRITIDVIYYTQYSRLVLEGYQNLLYASMSELYVFDTSKASYVLSNLFAIMVLLFCIYLFVFTVLYFIKHFNGYNEEEKFMMLEIYADLKNNKWARLYTPILLLRRFLLVVIVIW